MKFILVSFFFGMVSYLTFSQYALSMNLKIPLLSFFVLGGQPQVSVRGDHERKPWGILCGNLEGLTSVIDQGMAFCVMTTMYSLWSVSS